MARSLTRLAFLALAALVVTACSHDSPSAPSRPPTTTALPPIAEGRYLLRVTATGAAMGCEIAVPGVLGGTPLPAAGYFAQGVTLREAAGAWSITPDAAGATLELRVDGSGWPSTPRVTGSLRGQSDQRAYDGPGIDAGETGRPASFDGAVVPQPAEVDGYVMTGTVTGRLTFSAGWTGQVVVCRSALIVLQRS
jgi:hypothetical protein